MKRTRLIGALACAATLGVSGTAVADTTVTVTDGTPGWTRGDTRPDGTGAFQVGPAPTPAGVGSFRMTTPSSAAKVQLMTTQYTGMRLDAIEGIGYSTYRYSAPPASPALPAINIRLDLTGDGIADRFMVYEPYQDLGNAAVQDATWQDWDAHRGGTAEWWLSGAGPCGQATPCTWDAILALYPDATLAEGQPPGSNPAAQPGTLGVNQGSSNAGVDAASDALYVEIGGERTTYDFEPALSPASKDDCKNGGWQQFNAPAFKNQGDCVSSFAPGKNK
jgi:hypothetical protein